MVVGFHLLDCEISHPEKAAGPSWTQGHPEGNGVGASSQSETKVPGQEIQLQGAWGAGQAIGLRMRPPVGL